MTPKQIRELSKNAYKQWAVQWRKHATHHRKWPMKPLQEFFNSGIGKAILLVANGYSFEEEIEVIQKYHKNVDILCCDKTLGHLVSRGIKPKFCMVADANVNYQKYMEPWKDQLDETILLMNICGNTEWSDNGNWADRYFFVYKDVLGSEREFCALSGCQNILTAGTNVSNMMVVVVTQSDDENPGRNFMGYDKIILIGFDYSWRLNGKYYAFDQDGGGKAFYMRHIYGLSPKGNMIYTSGNLNSSASWMETYVKTFKLPVVQCSQESLAMFGGIRKLEDNIKHRYRTEDRGTVNQLVLKKKYFADEIRKINDKLRAIGKDHYLAHIATL